MRNLLRAGWERLEQGVLPMARWEMRAFMRGNRAPTPLLICTGGLISGRGQEANDGCHGGAER